MPDKKRIRVLVCDDSPLFAEAIVGAIEGDPEIDVIGIAEDGQMAVSMTERLAPDLITMDIRMPIMGGLEAIARIMANNPTPILVMTADPRGPTGELSFEALRRGALDLVEKPERWPSTLADRRALRSRLKLLAGVAVVRHPAARLRRAESTGEFPLISEGSGRIVGIVASTGGPVALSKIFEALPAEFPAGIVVVQHIAVGFAGSLARWLDSVTALKVQVAGDGMEVQPGVVLIAPDERHMTVLPEGRVKLIEAPAVDGHRPSGDLLLESVGQSYGRRGTGLVLTGMGHDGAAGLGVMREQGARTMCQDESTSAVYGMPKAAYENGAARRQLRLGQIPVALCEALGI